MAGGDGCTSLVFGHIFLLIRKVKPITIPITRVPPRSDAKTVKKIDLYSLLT